MLAAAPRIAAHSAAIRKVCLILFSYCERPETPLLVAANRDEFHLRPARPAGYWHDAPQVFGGRDLTGGGTWLGVSTTGRFAALTNFTDFAVPARPTPSRGDLPRQFLTGSASALDYARGIEGKRYQGFNLILFDGGELVYVSNRADVLRVLPAGAYGLANAPLDDVWPKSARGVAALRALPDDAPLEAALDVLRDESDGYVAEGGEPESAHRATPAFLRGRDYGTRASTAVAFAAGHIRFIEQLYGPMGAPGGRVTARIPIVTGPARQPSPP